MVASPSVVVFDLGGVLVRIRRSAREALKAMGYPTADVVRLTDTDAFQNLNAKYQSGHVTLQEFIEQSGALLDPVIPYASLLEAHDAVLMAEYPGALGVVQSLHELGVRTCVLSNTCARHWTTLVGLPAVSAASSGGCYLSFELGSVKPSASIYQRVQDDLGVAASEICFIDDSLQNVQAAGERGWRAELVPYERDDSGPLRNVVRSFGFDV